MMRRILVPFLFVTCGFVGGMILTGRFRAAEEARAEPRPAESAQVSAPSGIGTLPDLSAVASKTIPSVMYIASHQIGRTQDCPLASDPLRLYFFGGQQAAPRSRIAHRLCSRQI